MRLSPRDKSFLGGEHGNAGRMAMRILSAMADIYGAERLLTIESAHIDGCLYHGISGLEFAERLVRGQASVTVETTLNVGAIDLIHPHYFRGSAEQALRARRLMDCYVKMGCRPTWTCSPYQEVHRPPLGSQVAWAESNAVVFANSVLGARTNRYGDFIDICAAITGRAPAAGLHLAENRRGQILFRLRGLKDRLLRQDVFFPALGYLVGLESGHKVPVIEGLPHETSEDQLKALGAAAASSGAVALFHAVGITPEAPTRVVAFDGRPPEREMTIGPMEIREALGRLSTVPDGPIDVVAVGSPHFSIGEFSSLLGHLGDSALDSDVEFVACTNRRVLRQLEDRGWEERLKASGVQILVDSCVVVAPFVKASQGVLMTNSGKFAHYAPGNIGLQVVYGSLEECVRSARQGTVWRDQDLWPSLEG